MIYQGDCGSEDIASSPYKNFSMSFYTLARKKKNCFAWIFSYGENFSIFDKMLQFLGSLLQSRSVASVWAQWALQGAKKWGREFEAKRSEIDREPVLFHYQEEKSRAYFRKEGVWFSR